MASVYDLKPKFQALLRPLVRRLADGGLTANQVTVAAMLLSFAIGIPVGIIAAVRHNTLVDRLIMGANFIGISMPAFWFAKSPPNSKWRGSRFMPTFRWGR